MRSSRAAGSPGARSRAARRVRSRQRIIEPSRYAPILGPRPSGVKKIARSMQKVLHDEICVLVAVGMRITAHPPHRSRRAEFPHRALVAGNNFAVFGVGATLAVP